MVWILASSNKELKMKSVQLISEKESDRKINAIPRVLLTAASSGSGKTMITCGILKALKKRGLNCAAFKCGPDYIDPMFHRKVLGIDSYNLDTFMCGRSGVRKSLLSHGKERDICVMEGVMGYYDGIAGISKEASAWDVADATDTPAVLILDCKGVSVSAVAVAKGFLEYESKHHIRGVILNRISPMMYSRMKQMMEEQLGIQVLGYVPVVPDCVLESRYLGLQLPGEIEEIEEKLERLAEVIEETVNLDGILGLARNTSVLQEDIQDREILSDLRDNQSGRNQINSSQPQVCQMPENQIASKRITRIAVAQDEAFCFIYPDNLEILRKSGAEIVTFSPIHDEKLPENIQGIALYGGYPELYAKELNANVFMRDSIRKAVTSGVPCVAECGGFMYLQGKIEGPDGKDYEMTGALAGRSYKTEKLRRFGYITMSGGTVFGQRVADITAHEFHYYESEECGHAFTAKKPMSARGWECMISTETMLAGYPHIHYMGNQQVAEAFVSACRKYQEVQMYD